MFAPQIPPIIPTSIIPANKNNVLAESLPPAEKSIMTVIINKYKTEDNAPETMPLNAVNLEDNIPPKNPPSITQAIKNAPTELVRVSAFAKAYEKTNVEIKHITMPMTADNTIPMMFLVVIDSSFFRFDTFLCIKKSLTFNTEYEGISFIITKLFFVF